MLPLFLLGCVEIAVVMVAFSHSINPIRKEDAMTELRQRMIQDMQLHGFSPKTQRCYIDAVRNLARHYDRSPDLLSEEDVRHFFLHLINEKQAARSTVTIHLSGIKFLFEKTLQRPWPVFQVVKPAKRKKLPVVLAPDEIRSILALVRSPVQEMALTLIYACGLRLSEGACVRSDDIDTKRMLVWVRNGKGGKDRCVPLPEPILDVLQHYWRKGHPQPWLFPSRRKDGPISPSSLQKTFRDALRESGINKKASVHTLRHSYATHLLERGVDLRIIQKLLGHTCVRTTFVYVHLTSRIVDRLNSSLNALMAELKN